MACNYVKEFEFGSAGKAKGKPFAKGGCATTGYAKGGKVDPEVREAVHRHERNMHPKEQLTPLKKGGKVSPATKAMVKKEMMQTPTMKKESMMEKRMVKGPAMAAGRDPRIAMIEAPAMKCGGMYKKGK
jgi:hypothetical protein